MFVKTTLNAINALPDIRTDRDPGTDSALSAEHLWLVYHNGTNDVAIPQDTTNGLEYIGDYVFEVYGTYCDKIKSGAIGNIRIIIGCYPPY